MSKELTFVVARLKDNTLAGTNCVQLWSSDMNTIEIKNGDLVEISAGDKKTIANAYAAPIKDMPVGMVRMDNTMRTCLGVEIDDRVKIKKKN
jgi:formylmethanofuran dehydrogenase subunit D